MKIVSFGCTNYKAFKDPVEIKLAPLTLFFGKNNSGKSALLRLVPLLLRMLSMRQGIFPLSVGNLSYGRTFHDLIHGGYVHGAAEFMIALEHDNQHLDLATKVQNVRDDISHQGRVKYYPVVSKFCYRDNKFSEPLWYGREPLNPEEAYLYGMGFKPFNGLLPDPMVVAMDLSFIERTQYWRQEVSKFEDCLQHIGPLRVGINRVEELLSPVDSIGFNGERAVNQLGHHNRLLSAVSDWYQKNLDGWSLDVTRSGNAIEPLLNRGGSTVSLADAGLGMQQLLPIIVMQLGSQLDDQGTFLHLVEEPELHLHAAAHASLGDLFLYTAKTGRGQIIVETHSENLLLRIRRRIAEGGNPDWVAIYWLEDLPEGCSRVQRIHIQENGDFDWWPEGVFSEGYQEVLHLRRATHHKRLGGTP